MPSKRVKILVLSHMFPSKVHPHLGNQVYERVMELRKKFDVRVVSPVPIAPKFPKKVNPYYDYNLVPRKELIRGVVVYRPRYFTFPGMFLYSVDALTYYLGTVKLIKNIFRDWKFDLIDAHQAFPDGFVASEVAKDLLPKPKVITTIHGGDVYTPSLSFIRKWAIKKAIKSSDLVVAVSKNVKVKLESLGFKSNIVTIPIGVKIRRRIPELPSKVKNKIKNKFVVLTVGNLIKRKGQIYVLRAINKIIKKYKNVFCIVVGSGPEFGNLRDFVRANNLERYIYFTGAIPNSEAHAYFKASNVFVLPSWDEALGIVYMEAMMYGKPAIGCANEGAAELISNKKDGFLVKSRDEKQIVECLEKLILDRELLKKLGISAKKKAESFFRIENSIQKIEQQIDNLFDKNLDDYRKTYNERYYKDKGERFDVGKHKSFGVFFKKFEIAEPILDLECGTGLFMKEAVERGYKDIVGLEVSRYAVSEAKKNGLRVYLYKGKKIPFKDNTFKTVFCYQVIEHIPRKDADFLLGECYRVLQSGGKLLLFAPAEYQEFYNTDPVHINFYPIKYFQNLITNLGFKINSFESTMFLPAMIRNIQPFSYILSKYLYKVFKKWGTTIEMEAVKL